ncbi:hypothetical protein Y032_0644g1078 [Ancylostoma ceylanicum]|uniref:Uncharacterized protein n=1 Tax=Ancylostoma ceylanicum TaxID=53326 RepID=A0A016WJB9_9BILA|nr:hypothetical protein Y032_0644g1078 [Ancylostoma ceylanicum]
MGFPKSDGQNKCIFGNPRTKKKIVSSTVGVHGADPFAASKSTRRHPTAHGGIVAAVANLGFLDGCSSQLMVTNKKTN